MRDLDATQSRLTGSGRGGCAKVSNFLLLVVIVSYVSVIGPVELWEWANQDGLRSRRSCTPTQPSWEVDAERNAMKDSRSEESTSNAKTVALGGGNKARVFDSAVAVLVQ